MSFGTTFVDQAARLDDAEVNAEEDKRFDGAIGEPVTALPDDNPLRRYTLNELLAIDSDKLDEHDPVALFQALQSEFRHLSTPLPSVSEATDTVLDILRGSDLGRSLGFGLSDTLSRERWAQWEAIYQKRIDDHHKLRGLLQRAEDRLRR